MAKQKISWIIPIFNEEKNIPALYAALKNLREKLAATYTTEFVFIDDGSRDNSLSLLKELYDKDKDVKVLALSKNFGQQIAITAGLDYATGDAIIFMDADMQDPPEVSFDLIAKWKEGFDVVYAKRRSRRDNVFKRFTAYWYYRILRSITDVDIPEDTGEFRLISKPVADALRTFKEKHPYVRGLVSYVGFKQTIVMFDRKERMAGVTGYSMKKMINLAVDGLLGFSLAPLQLISAFGVFSFVLGIVGTIVSAFTKNWNLGLASYATVLAGILLVAMGILGVFIGRMYQETQNRPLYILKAKLVR